MNKGGDDDSFGEEGSSSIKHASSFLISSTWLVIEQLEETKSFLSWQHGRSSISLEMSLPPSSQDISSLTLSLPCGTPHDGEVEDIEVSK